MDPLITALIQLGIGGIWLAYMIIDKKATVKAADEEAEVHRKEIAEKDRTIAAKDVLILELQEKRITAMQEQTKVIQSSTIALETLTDVVKAGRP